MGTASKWLNFEAQMDANKKYLQGVQETNQTNRELAEKQNQWNLEQWNRENDYNDPKAQAARLQGAGLSAAATAQAVGNIPASPLQSADLANQVAPGPVQAPKLEASDSLLNIARQLEALKSDMLGNQMKEQDASIHNRMLLTEADKQQWIVDKMQQEYNQAGSLFPYRTTSLLAEIENRRASTNYYQQAAEKEKADTMRIHQDFDFYKDYNEQRKKELAEQINNIVKAGKKLDAETENVKAQTSESQSRKVLNEKQGNLIDTEKKGQELQNLLTRGGMPSSVAQRTAIMLASGELSTDDFFNILEDIDKYNKGGYGYFSGSPESRNYLQNVYDEGEAIAGSRSPHQVGPWRELFRHGWPLFNGE